MAEITSSLVAPPPKHSLNVSIAVAAGLAQSTRALGTYTGYYPSIVSTTELYIDLQPAAAWLGTEAGALFVNTNQPLSFVGTKPDNTTVTLTINRMMFLDQTFKSWSLANDTNNTATVFLSSSTPALSTGTLQPAPVRSVNGNFPDAQGNVQVDTGVMTVDNVQPDAQGNVNTDEQTY